MGLLTLFLGCLCLGFDIRMPHSHVLTDTVPVLLATSSAPWSSCHNGDVLGQLEMLLMYMGSAHEAAEQTTEGLLTR